MSTFPSSANIKTLSSLSLIFLTSSRFRHLPLERNRSDSPPSLTISYSPTHPLYPVTSRGLSEVYRPPSWKERSYESSTFWHVLLLLRGYGYGGGGGWLELFEKPFLCVLLCNIFIHRRVRSEPWISFFVPPPPCDYEVPMEADEAPWDRLINWWRSCDGGDWQGRVQLPAWMFCVRYPSRRPEAENWVLDPPDPTITSGAGGYGERHLAVFVMCAVVEEVLRNSTSVKVGIRYKICVLLVYLYCLL